MDHGLKCKIQKYKASRRNCKNIFMTLGLDKDILDRATKILIIKGNNKLYFIKPKHFYSSKGTIKEIDKSQIVFKILLQINKKRAS